MGLQEERHPLDPYSTKVILFDTKERDDEEEEEEEKDLRSFAAAVTENAGLVSESVTGTGGAGSKHYVPFPIKLRLDSDINEFNFNNATLGQSSNNPD
jgi:hypothetical protein